MFPDQVDRRVHLQGMNGLHADLVVREQTRILLKNLSFDKAKMPQAPIFIQADRGFCYSSCLGKR